MGIWAVQITDSIKYMVTVVNNISKAPKVPVLTWLCVCNATIKEQQRKAMRSPNCFISIEAHSKTALPSLTLQLGRPSE